ncbi:4'-phosphopantetheinyl transferase family protein [Streptomyces sp. NPDC051569]|uniref:4'-phosphopantetheinyl transferase family protein n=1 Tax=Streptomyces sp. NPDC051569 TaxID=3365661 RepID=UPI0037AD3A00
MTRPLSPAPSRSPSSSPGVHLPIALGTGWTDLSPPPFPADAPQVWLVDAAEHHQAAASQAPDTLDVRELARAAEFLHSADRDTYVCAHVALRRLLGAYLGLPPRAVSISRAPCPGCQEPHGRPVVPGASLHFSLSHCGDLSLLAFAAAPVGVDVEAFPSPRTIVEAADVLHPLEAAELATLPPAERPPAFTRVWTRKEAYLKGLGIGLSGSPHTAYVGTGPVSAALPGWTVTDVRVPGGYCAAVAVRDR